MKIKAQDLRIGNFAKFKHLEGKIISIDENYCELDCTSMVIKSDYEDLKPIPFTKERLERFGFNSNPYSNEYGGNNMIFHNHGEYLTWGTTKMYYMHQIQNLYYIINSEELKEIEQ